MAIYGCGDRVTAIFLKVFPLAGIITALVTQKKNKSRVNVFLDDEFAFAVTLNAALSLKKGQHLSDDRITSLKNADAIDKAYQQSLNYLSYRARSEAEVFRYLRKKAVSEEAISHVIDRLLRHGYLNDAAFGEQWVASRTRTKPKGARALRFELRQKGLADTDIEVAVANIDETALAWQAVENKLPRWLTLDVQARRKKITAFLGRRGFNYDVITVTLTKIEAIASNTDD